MELEVLKLELGELSALPDLEFDLWVTGFSDGEVNSLLADRIDPDDEVIRQYQQNPARGRETSGS